MITLAMDTSTSQGTVAVLNDDQLVASATFGRDGLFDAITRLNPGPFDRLVVGVGPGSFTGIRAGIAAAKGFSDARRGELYYARYDRLGQPVVECRIGTVETLAGELCEPTWFISAEIDRYAARLRSIGVVCSSPIFPSAAILGRLGRRQTRALPLEPIYLRELDYRQLPSQPKPTGGGR